jgi:hypothetical protein
MPSLNSPVSHFRRATARLQFFSKFFLQFCGGWIKIPLTLTNYRLGA